LVSLGWSTKFRITHLTVGNNLLAVVLHVIKVIMISNQNSGELERSLNKAMSDSDSFITCLESYYLEFSRSSLSIH